MLTCIKTAWKCGWTDVVVVYPVCPCQPRNRGLAHLSLVPSHLWPMVNHSEARTHTACRCGAGLCLLPGQCLDLVSCIFHACFHASMLPPYNQPPITIHTPASCTANIPPLNLSLVADRDTDSVALSQVFQVLTFDFYVVHPWTSKI